MLNLKGIIKWLRSPLFWILILAGFLRLYQLGTNPPGFFRDEAAKGYNAYCLLKTGRDIDNRSLPIFTREFTVYNSALPTYLVIPSIVLFGLTEFATRLPFAVVGILTVFLTYLLTSRVYNPRTGYLAAFLLAVSPWHLLFSRWANQGILLPLFITAGLYCWIRAFEPDVKHTKQWLISSLIIFAISLYTYDIAKVFIPLFLVGLFIIYRQEIRRNSLFFLLGLCCFLILILPQVWFSLTAPELTQERFNRISIFALSNSPSAIFNLFIKNYVTHFSPNFLFISGDSNLRHSVFGLGQLYLFEIPFLLYGIYILFRQRTKFEQLLIWWVVLFPVPASLTYEGIPHALRTICAIPVFSIITAHAIDTLLQRVPVYAAKSFSYRGMRVLIMTLIIANISFFIFNLFFFYPQYSAPVWQYGWRDA
ncbi:MAG: glycosyltransferase family 39 protein, partial [bacterium]|nr:glycosyltransferase family 39 protein [bacterium]